MSVLNDAYTAPREELTRISELRQLGERTPTEGIQIHKQTQTELRGSLSDHEPDLTPVRGTHELHEQVPRNETEPYGMYWVNENGVRRLRPHAWFVRYIATQADSVFLLTREALSDNEEATQQYTELGNALREYVEQRGNINPMSTERKYRQELDDAAYQFCQAAKYRIDAQERARFLTERNEDVVDNEQIASLMNRAQEAAHEGYVLAYAVRHAGFNEPMNFEASARRVLEYSCRRLTEWFAKRRANTEQQQQLQVSATNALIDKMFLRNLK